MDRADHYFGYMRFKFAQLRSGEHRKVDAILIEPVRVRDRLVQAFLGAETMEPTSVVHEALRCGARLSDQRVVLVDTVRHQRSERPRRPQDAFGCRILPITEQPRC